ncbi:beta-1,6-glucanase [Paenibacillus sp. CAA11]|uniref:glycoside hydrolase family 30 protein n=1 Tax=Paenibacillus sp. CAA11 TaxID=1532905 RepID=UPI000D3B6171|nr:glycoside hydrolase family 30 beta sandwich domain-containing protein [Paenibacillus sp. CAA11]AWB43519.1 beta-1,6-glucanase [Paenibacillus sp. CAA11]
MFRFRRKPKILIALALIAVCIVIMLSVMLGRAETAGGTVQVWMTTADQSNLLTAKAPVTFYTDNTSSVTTIDVNPGIKYQTMDGFGASITGSTAYLMNHKLSSGQREALLKDLFTEQGIHLSFLRHSIGASDFSVDAEGKASTYTYDDIPAGTTDYMLSHFSVAKDADVIRTLQEIVKLNPRVKIMGTPWTAPAWMKYGAKIPNGWYLNYENPQVYKTYAQYFVKYIQAYKQSGVPIYAVTLQNEPEFTTPNYPSMSMGAEEQATFIRDSLGPAFKQNDISAKIIGYDHNWDQGVRYADKLLSNEGARAYTDGTAYHCYAGEPEAMSEVHAEHPDKGIYFTECGGGDWNMNFGDNLSWEMSNLMIGAPRNWAKTVLMWNMALDDQGGPANGGCQNCRGVVTIDPKTGEVTKNVEYYVLGHTSKFVQPGAVRIDSSPQASGIQSVAYQNPDGSTVLVVHNTDSEGRAFKVRYQSRSFAYSLPSQGVVTFTWKSA